MAGESEAITASLSELYVKLETGQITEEQFDAQEKALLDRLQAQGEAAREPEKKLAKPRAKAKRNWKKSTVVTALPV